MGEEPGRESGFSLVELLVAMLIAVIVSGAIYGMIAAGQGAFRREPELSDRQQNIRAAMDMIQRDIERAGLGLPPFAQVFGTPLSGAGTTPDTLEILAGAETCPPVAICKSAVGGTNATYEMPSSQPPNSACPGLPRLVAITPGPTNDPLRELFVIGVSGAPALPGAVCLVPLNSGLNASAGGSPVGSQVVVPTNQGPPAWRPAGGAPLNAANLQMLVPVDVVRYQIAPDPTDVGDPTIPCLWRSTTGGRALATNYTAIEAIPGGPWQLVARGITDLQVTYASVNPAAPVITDDAPVAVANNFTTLVFDVQVTLTARVSARYLQGDATGTQRLSGQLTSSAAPRAALVAFTRGAGASLWN